MARNHIFLVAIIFIILSCSKSPHDEKNEVLESFFVLMHNEYYDAEFTGIAFEEFKKRVRIAAAEAHDSSELYSVAFRPALLKLEVSHANAWSPEEFSGRVGTVASPVVEADLFACFGLVVQNVRPGIMPRVVADLRPEAGIDISGPTVGWHLISWEPAIDHRLRTTWTDPMGNKRKVTLELAKFTSKGPDIAQSLPVDKRPVTVLHRMDASARQILQDLQERRADPTTPVYYAPLGLVLSAGRSGNLPRIIDVQHGRPGEAHGLSVGDLVVGVSAKKLRNTTRLELKTMRDGKVRSVNLQRQCDRQSFVRPPLITKSGDIAFVRFDEFTPQAAASLREQAEGITARHIVFDLRRNLGGSTAVLSEIAAMFFGPNQLIGYVNRRRVKGEIRAEGDHVTSSPFRAATLTSPITASSAEAFAYFARAKTDGTIAGMRSSGSVLVSKMFRLPDGGVVQIPTRELTMFDGQILEGRGVLPDADVPQGCNAISLESCKALFEGTASRQ
ncbi:hypothetical protein EB810_13755 [Altererythrobacter sp. FM1]|uniref:S41 family peptidase n=1 Tax=Tsuneonella flava TaxID=2055955 RepID=UPI000C7F923B|nr:S41 family peptidase [Tsuneonella flava]ROT94130.1 hypothetical protein EB810_13755 [Altererythrobacter sp. FM1]